MDNKLKDKVLLPGTEKQFAHLLSEADTRDKKLLIIGSGCEDAAVSIVAECKEVSIIVNNHDALINSRLRLKNNPAINVKFMDYEHTDFNSNSFDIVYAQASLSVSNRNKILKEIRRILFNDGILNTGEIFYPDESVPAFVSDVMSSENLQPLTEVKLINFYTERGFELIDEKDLTASLRDYYTTVENILADKKREHGEDELKPDKKMLGRIKHQANVYLKLGGDRFLGFRSFILRKKA